MPSEAGSKSLLTRPHLFLQITHCKRMNDKNAKRAAVLLLGHPLVRDRVGEIYSSGFILSQNSVSVKLLLVFVYTIFIIIFSSSMNS